MDNLRVYSPNKNSLMEYTNASMSFDLWYCITLDLVKIKLIAVAGLITEKLRRLEGYKWIPSQEYIFRPRCSTVKEDRRLWSRVSIVAGTAILLSLLILLKRLQSLISLLFLFRFYLKFFYCNIIYFNLC